MGQVHLAPLPSEAAQQASAKRIADVYKSDYATAKSPQQKVDLAKKLFKDALATKGDAGGQLAMLQASLDLAAQEGDLGTAWQAIDRMAERWQIDAIQRKLATAETSLKAARSKQARLAVIPFLSRLSSAALAADNLATAKRAVTLASQTATDNKEFKTARIFLQQTAAIAQDEQTFAKVTAALATLEKSPIDREANRTVGEWYCWKKQDWKQGLNYLALGSDPTLAKLARQELEVPRGGEAQLALADGWWAAAEALEEKQRPPLAARARHWYRQAPGLSGLAEARVRQRLTETLVWELDSPLHFAGFEPYSFCGLGIKPKGPPQFAYTEQADAVVLGGGALIAPRQFSSITAADIVLGVPAGKHGVTLAVGQATMILNWDNNQNHFRYANNQSFDNHSSPTSPFVLLPGRFHVVSVRETDGTVTVAIDGKQHYSVKGKLDGTITVAARLDEGVLLLKKITVEGISDPNIHPTLPRPLNLF